MWATKCPKIPYSATVTWCGVQKRIRITTKSYSLWGSPPATSVCHVWSTSVPRWSVILFTLQNDGTNYRRSHNDRVGGRRRWQGTVTRQENGAYDVRYVRRTLLVLRSTRQIGPYDECTAEKRFRRLRVIGIWVDDVTPTTPRQWAIYSSLTSTCDGPPTLRCP